MNNLTQYIKEAIESPKNLPEDTEIPVNSVIKACQKLSSQLIDPKKAGLQNADMIIDFINDNKINTDKFQFFNIKDYYEQYFDAGSKYNRTDKSFTNKYGDIVVLDDSDSECAYIKVLIGKDDYPPVSYGELQDFEVTGVFVFINQKTGSVKGLTNVHIKDWLKEHKECLETTGDGKAVNGVIGKYSYNDYISGKLIAGM